MSSAKKEYPLFIALAGPTASGKSEVAVALCERLHQRQGIPMEVISADSMLVYKHMDIGTAKPSGELLSRIPHHMIDIIEPAEQFNVSLFERQASEILRRLISQGRGAVVAGGTGLYFKALIDGLNDAPAADEGLRKKLEREAEEQGPQRLYERLHQVDPEACGKIHPNNTRRVIRALEVYLISGKTFTSFHREQEPPPWREHFRWIGLFPGFETLDERIARRTRQMFEQGLIEEVRNLLAMGVGPQCTAMQGLGYKEVAEGLASGMSEEEMQSLVDKKTRRYARRQLTWWRPEKRVEWLSPGPEDKPGKIADQIMERL